MRVSTAPSLRISSANGRVTGWGQAQMQGRQPIPTLPGRTRRALSQLSTADQICVTVDCSSAYCRNHGAEVARLWRNGMRLSSVKSGVCIEWPERASSSMRRRKLICAFPLPLIPSFTSGTMATGVEESRDVEVKFSFGWGAYLSPTLVRVQLSHTRCTGASPRGICINSFRIAYF